MARYATCVVVSSRAALADFERFAPQAAHKACVLSFVAQIPRATYDVDPALACRAYGVPERFIYLPNQFWRHKNHQLVVRALQIARETAPTIKVVCTGSVTDWRDPHYSAQLQEEIGKREPSKAMSSAMCSPGSASNEPCSWAKTSATVRSRSSGQRRSAANPRHQCSACALRSAKSLN